MRRFLLFAALAITPPAAAAAADCVPVAALFTISAESGARDLLAPGMATCFTARETTGEALACFTVHPFRSEAARAGFDALGARISACLPDGAATAGAPYDSRVNHPDSYDARAWDAPGARISLSLKDKGGQGRTLIFLRVTAAE